MITVGCVSSAESVAHGRAGSRSGSTSTSQVSHPAEPARWPSPLGLGNTTATGPPEDQELTPAGAKSGGVTGQYRLARSGYYRSDPPRAKPMPAALDWYESSGPTVLAHRVRQPLRDAAGAVPYRWAPKGSLPPRNRAQRARDQHERPPGRNTVTTSLRPPPSSARIWTGGATARGAQGPPRRRPGGVDPGSFHVVSQPCPRRHRGCRRWAAPRRTPSSCSTGRRSRGARSSPSPPRRNRRTRC